MERLALAACLLFLTGNAWAQPQEIASEGLIQLSAGSTKAFSFSEGVGSIYFAPKDVVEAVPQNDREFTISPLKPGSTRMFVRSKVSGNLLYNVDIVVAPEPGHIVRLYGQRDVKDYTGFYCTASGCGRADGELAGSRDPSSVSLTERTPTGDGGFQETTKTYGR